MTTKLKMRKVMFLLSLGVILMIASASLAYASLFFSTDIPATIGSNSFEERDIIKYEPPDFSLYLSGSTLGIPKGVNINAFGISGSNNIFSVDVPITLGGMDFTERDLILYDGTNFSKLLDGSDVGIPDGARINAATVLSDGSIIFSLDIPASMGGLSFKANDLIKYDGSSFSLYFNGLANGIPESANIDGVWVSSAGEILFSLDIPCSLNGLEVKDKDIIKWSNGSLSKYFDGTVAGLPEGSDIDSLFTNNDLSLILSFLFEDNGGTTTDSSGNGNNGTVNGAIFTTGEGVCDSNAYQFAWSSANNIQVPYQESQTTTDALTLEAWIYPTAWDNIYYGYNRIVSKQPVYLLRGANGVAHFQILTANHGYQGILDSNIMTLNQWHYVVGTFDGQLLKLYVDGVLKGSYDMGVKDNIVTNQSDIYVGESPGLNEGFSGTIDNVAIYKRARLQSEIEQTYASIAPCITPTIGSSPESFNFTATYGGPNPPNQDLSISNTGGGTLGWSVSDDAAWLSLSPTSGTDSGTVMVSVDITGLISGTYNATITITATGATNSPVNIPVTLTITDSTPPTSGITAPINGAGIINTTYTILGTASDVGSQIQKVEVSINGGAWTEATGATSWSYAWTIPSEGSYTIQSRATDASGNVETASAGVNVTVYFRQPTPVTIEGRQLLVNGNPLTIKGVGYSPVPIGDDPETTSPYGDYFTSDYSNIYDRDLPLLRQMGANTVRLWGWNNNANHIDFLDKAYNGGVDPIYVIAGYWINGGLDIDPNSPANVREQLKAGFREMVAACKNHPAILMWAIGNELNADWMYGNDLNNLFSLINEMAEEAHAEDPNHPVTTPLADINLINTISTYNAFVPSLDIWGANIYRGNTFGSLFSEYNEVSSKPLVILEYGIDAYDNVHGNEYENIGNPYQADYAEALWKEIEANSDTCIGGSIMAYSDEWWKGKYSTDPGCPDNNPTFHSTCGYPSTSHPDGYSNEEWWGIMRTVDNGTNPDIMEPRAVYYRLHSIWLPHYTLTVNKSGTGSGAVISSPAGITCGSDCLESYDPGTVVTLKATADAGSVVTGWSGSGCSGPVTCTVTKRSAHAQ
ncbi:MAG: LamG-like jellyroll fold domain-containing protein [Nitrospirota bacterium]